MFSMVKKLLIFVIITVLVCWIILYWFCYNSLEVKVIITRSGVYWSDKLKSPYSSSLLKFFEILNKGCCSVYVNNITLVLDNASAGVKLTVINRSFSIVPGGVKAVPVKINWREYGVWKIKGVIIDYSCNGLRFRRFFDLNITLFSSSASKYYLRGGVFEVVGVSLKRLSVKVGEQFSVKFIVMVLENNVSIEIISVNATDASLLGYGYTTPPPTGFSKGEIVEITTYFHAKKEGECKIESIVIKYSLKGRKYYDVIKLEEPVIIEILGK